jgi:transposase
MVVWFTMSTLSIDLRERIVAAYDAGEGTREEIAERFMVSLGMVKKLLAQRKATGDIAPRHKNSGRRPKITADHRQRIERLLADRSDLTLAQLREALGLECSLPALHYVLKSMGLSYKKRLSAPASRTGPT